MLRTILRAMLALSLAVMPLLAGISEVVGGSPPNLLDKNSGRVLANPEIHNVYADFNWDSGNSSTISTSAIDGFTNSLVSSNYFAKAGQYGISGASFTGGNEASIVCPPPYLVTPDGTRVTDFFSLDAWMTCETAPGPDPILFPDPPSGLPSPDDNTLYAVYLPYRTAIVDPTIQSCQDFSAYHFSGTTLVWRFEITVFPPFIGWLLEPQNYAYTIVPADCALLYATNHNDQPIDGISYLASHEIIEAATDPNVTTGWIDNSLFGFNADILKQGEAADICEQPDGPRAINPVRLTNGLLVAPYWSNADNACKPNTHTFHLGETGLPGTVAHQALFDGGIVSLPFDVTVDDNTVHSYRFPATVNDPNPGIRYVTTTPPMTIAVTADFSLTASYSTQYFLTVQASPPAAAALDVSLTPSAWEKAGTVATATTDPLVTVGPNSRFRFDHWSGNASGTSPTTTLLMNGPKSATANYVSQHLVTVNTNGLGANNTHIFNGTTLLGMANDSSPLVLFVDDGPLALNADANVNGAGGVQYFFQSFTPAPPSSLTAALTTTANYEAMSQLIGGSLASGGIFGPGAAGLANSYTMQFAAVQADIAAGNDAQALADLQSFISHVQAQSGKHMTAALATTLQLDALLIFHNALCLGVTAGQIDAGTAAVDYSFYSTLETSLGGTVLPPC